MIPDYSFELFFHDHARRAVAQAFAKQSLAEDRHDLIDAIISGAGSTDFTLLIQHRQDPAILRWLEHLGDTKPPNLPAETVAVGRVTLWVKQHDSLPYGEQPAVPCLELSLWPATKLMQRTFLESPILCAWLADVLSHCDGIVCYLNPGDGSLVEFWPHAQFAETSGA